MNQRCEVKNMNSMRFARQAIEYEFKRQIDQVERGGQVEQQTLNFDPQTGTTSPLRDKEDAHDYRYFPDPDLPPLILTTEYIETIKSQMSPLPWELKKEFQEKFGLKENDVELLTEQKTVALYFQNFVNDYSNYKSAANLFINKLIPYLKENNLEPEELKVSVKTFKDFLELIDDGKVSSAIAFQRLFPALFEHPEITAQQIAEQLNLLQTSDTNFLEDLVRAAVEKYPDKVRAYRNGKKGLIGFFMGEVMKNSKGKAEPKATNVLLRKYLEGNN